MNLGDSIRTVSVGVHKLHPDAFDPVYATPGSACFDIHACFPDGRSLIKAFTENNKEIMLLAAVPNAGDRKHILIPPKHRAMIPPQLIFDIQDSWSVRIHMRSGLAIKGGLILSNSEGIIDSDYTDELMVLVTNTSDVSIRVNHGDRICQGELAPVYRAQFNNCNKPNQKTSRDGGFGSTGKS